jgi:hypothetical protein
MTVFLDKINHYTTLEAQGLAAAKAPYRGRDLALCPLWTFFKLYVLKQGFRDGLEGLLFCLLSGVSAGVRAWKHRELTRARLTPGWPGRIGITPRRGWFLHPPGPPLRRGPGGVPPHAAETKASTVLARRAS